jgi:hypothetical protein
MNGTLAGVDKLAHLIRTLDGNHDLGTGVLAELLTEHGVVLYCMHPGLTRMRERSSLDGGLGHAATCPKCGNYWYASDAPPEVLPQRIAGMDPAEPV